MNELTMHGEPARFAGGWHEVGERTWAYLQPNGGLGESNSGLIHDDGHVMFVDSLWDLQLTRKMLDEARAITDSAPELLFNTHSDGDHVWGNQLFTDAHIVSTTQARKLMTLDPPRSLRAMRRGGSMLGLLGRLPLPVVGPVDYGSLPRLPLKEMGREMVPFDWRGIELTLPDETFDEQLSVTVGSRAVELIEVGPAHTIGDAVAFVPDVAVCFAADILFIGGTPIMWAGPIASWRSALDTISGLGAEIFVPGHGPVCGQAEVDQLREYFAWVEIEGAPLLERGFSPMKVGEQLLFSEEFASAPWGGWDDPARLIAILHTESFRRNGGVGQLGGSGRSRAIMQMQLVKTKLARKRPSLDQE